LTFQTDGLTLGRGFRIDKIEYMTSTQSDFPYNSMQFNGVGATEANPDYGDAQRRLADRLIHMPDTGSVTFNENKYTITSADGQNIADRSFRLNFSFSQKRLNNLVRDGNETVEVQLEFYNSEVSTQDSYGRPSTAFYPWLTTIGSSDSVDTANPSGPSGSTPYHDDWDSPGWIDQEDRGSYFYYQNKRAMAIPSGIL
jgi:hypothetical protein